MKRRATQLGLIGLLGCGILLGACARTPQQRPEVVVVEKKGPPPHAAAHGYRHKHHDGTELIFNTQLGVYVVVGRDGHYFLDGWYYRHGGDSWQCAVHLDKSWSEIDVSEVPPGLRKHGRSPEKKPPRGRASTR